MDHVIEAAVPEKYKHIDFKPPEGVRKAAKRGLEMRREFKRGGTAVGVARARDLMNGKTISPSTARRMKAYFDRHQPDQKAEGFSAGEEGYPSAGRVAWLLWGSDAGYSWAKKLVKQMNSADEKGKVRASSCGCAESCDCGCQAPGGGQPPADMTISNLKQIVRDASELLDLLHEDMELMGWAEDKVSQAKVAIDSVKNYVLNDFPWLSEPPAEAPAAEAPVVLTVAAAKKKPWEEKREPKGNLSKHWREEAEKRAKKAGRKYPNMVDNMWAAQQQNKAKASVAAALRAAATALLGEDK